MKHTESTDSLSLFLYILFLACLVLVLCVLEAHADCTLTPNLSLCTRTDTTLFTRANQNSLVNAVDALATTTGGNNVFLGGTTTTSPLRLRTTTGNAAAGADIIFQGGNNGGTELGRLLGSTSELAIAAGSTLQGLNYGGETTAQNRLVLGTLGFPQFPVQNFYANQTNVSAAPFPVVGRISFYNSANNVTREVARIDVTEGGQGVSSNTKTSVLELMVRSEEDPARTTPFYAHEFGEDGNVLIGKVLGTGGPIAANYTTWGDGQMTNPGAISIPFGRGYFSSDSVYVSNKWLIGYDKAQAPAFIRLTEGDLPVMVSTALFTYQNRTGVENGGWLWPNNKYLWWENAAGTAPVQEVGLDTANTLSLGTGKLTIASNGMIGLGLTETLGFLGNTNTNIVDAVPTGVSGVKNIVWLENAGGYMAGFYNASVATNANGLLIKIAGTASTNRILTVGTGATQGGAGTDVFVVQGNGNVGIGTGTPAASALLDLTSTTGALLPPRMTTTQRDALTAVDGMLVYNTTTGALNYRKAGVWTAI